MISQYVPMASTLVREPFHRPGWIYEEKYDDRAGRMARAGAARGDLLLGADGGVVAGSGLPGVDVTMTENHTPDPFIGSMLEGVAERYRRFAKHFQLHNDVNDAVNQVLEEETAHIKIRSGEQRLLSVLMGTFLGKAMKTYAAVQRLCVLGYGEDAAVLLRSNVNLLVNLAYIVSDSDPDARAQEFAAYACVHKAQLVKAFGEDTTDIDDLGLDAADIPRLAKAWKRTTIEVRAKSLPDTHHYNQGYRFYSSIEHSDVFSLGGYIGEWNEAGTRIESGPNDSHVSVVLMHNPEVMVRVLHYACRYWGIARPDISSRVTAAFLAFTQADAQS